jgi:hypothetical protein
MVTGLKATERGLQQTEDLQVRNKKGFEKDMTTI